jgi:error-prone DNA polymerase
VRCEKHGVEVRPVCINASQWDCTLEAADRKHLSVRLGLRMVKGLTEAYAATLIARRVEVPYRSVEDVWRRTTVPIAALEQLADADAFLGLRHYCPEFSERTASKYLTYNGFSAILGGVDLK